MSNNFAHTRKKNIFFCRSILFLSYSQWLQIVQIAMAMDDDFRLGLCIIFIRAKQSEKEVGGEAKRKYAIVILNFISLLVQIIWFKNLSFLCHYVRAPIRRLNACTRMDVCRCR